MIPLPSSNTFRIQNPRKKHDAKFPSGFDGGESAGGEGKNQKRWPSHEEGVGKPAAGEGRPRFALPNFWGGRQRPFSKLPYPGARGAAKKKDAAGAPAQYYYYPGDEPFSLGGEGRARQRPGVPLGVRVSKIGKISIFLFSRDK